MTFQPDMRMWAVRGATTVDANTRDAVLAASSELVSAVLERNELEPDRIVSCIFTATDGLDAEFPAVAARKLGLDQVPLLCAREIPVPGSMPDVIRLLAHYYAPADHTPEHIYLGKAKELRSDLHAAQ